MKKLLLLSFLALILISQNSNAQWVESGTLKNINWNYSFIGTPNTISGTGGIMKTSTPTLEDFLPKPTSGAVEISSHTNTTANSSSFTLDGTDALLMVASNTATNPGKFLAKGFQDASQVMSAHFNLKLNNTIDNKGANWYIVIGGEAGDVFNQGTVPSVTGNNSFDNTIYTVLRITKSTVSGKYSLGVRYHTSTTVVTDWSWYVLKSNIEPNDNLKIDLYCNNAPSGRSYKIGETSYSIPTGLYHVWLNDVQVGLDVESTGTVNEAQRLSRNVRVYNSSGIKNASHTSNLTAISIMNRDAATSEVAGTPATTVNANSASIEISNFKVTHLGTIATTPVTFADFTGKATNNGVALNWQTSSESNNSHFIIKRSASSSDFSYLGRTDAKGDGTSTAVNNYSYTDNNPVAGTNYYQLVQVDKDGTENEFNKVLAINYGVEANALSVTKVSDNNLKITLNADKAETSEIMITDIAGKIIYKGKRMLKAGVNEFEVSVSGASHKVSVVRVQTPTSSNSTKIVL